MFFSEKVLQTFLPDKYIMSIRESVVTLSFMGLEDILAALENHATYQDQNMVD